MILLTRIFLLMFSSILYATTYVPVAIERQLAESTMVIEGRWTGSDSKKLATGEIVTEHWFALNKSSHPQIKNFLVQDEFPVLVLGGQVGNENVVLEGAPTFKENEEVLLFVKSNEKGNWLQGLAAGKYDVKKIGSRKIYVSSIFPSHPVMGQIEDIHLGKLVRKIKGTYFIDFKKIEMDEESRLKSLIKTRERFVMSDETNNSESAVLPTKRLGRKIASIGEEEESENKVDGLGAVWIVIIFAIIGGLAQMRNRKGMH